MGHGSPNYSEGEFHWKKDLSLEEQEPHWVRMYGSELHNRPMEEWGWTATHLYMQRERRERLGPILPDWHIDPAQRDLIARTLLNRAHAKLEATNIFERLSPPPIIVDQTGITLDQRGDVVELNPIMQVARSSYRYNIYYGGGHMPVDIRWLNTNFAPSGWRVGPSGSLISPGEQQLRTKAAQYLAPNSKTSKQVFKDFRDHLNTSVQRNARRRR